jgi:hypothetical protein
MQTSHQYSHSQHGCGAQSRGPEVFYGYCHETNRMRMMDYTDYANNMQTGYSNLVNNPSSSMRSLIAALSSMLPNPATSSPTTPQYHHHKHGCGCQEDDCACWCCIRCADVVEYARCTEARVIPISFDNDTRRERDVILELGNFATEGGQDLGWQASVSPNKFKLQPCGSTTVALTVHVDCSKWGVPTKHSEQGTAAPTLDGCKVAYATLRADGCTVRPIVIAVAVLPAYCGAHHAGCGCSCCN